MVDGNEILAAVLSLREATEMSFTKVEFRFDKLEFRVGALETKIDRFEVNVLQRFDNLDLAFLGV